MAPTSFGSWKAVAGSLLIVALAHSASVTSVKTQVAANLDKISSYQADADIRIRTG